MGQSNGCWKRVALSLRSFTKSVRPSSQPNSTRKFHHELLSCRQLFANDLESPIPYELNELTAQESVQMSLNLDSQNLISLEQDLNGDGVLSPADALQVANAINGDDELNTGTSLNWSSLDVNADGILDSKDFDVMIDAVDRVWISSVAGANSPTNQTITTGLNPTLPCNGLVPIGLCDPWNWGREAQPPAPIR